MALSVVVPSPAPTGVGHASRAKAHATGTAAPGSAATGPTPPGGFCTGRRLGDALAWLAQERGVTSIEQLVVTDVGPAGRRSTVVSDEGGAFRADTPDLPAELGAGVDTTGRFQARDLAPDVLTRATGRARREHPETWTHVVHLEAVVDRPRPSSRWTR